jgi:hypothetical protein
VQEEEAQVLQQEVRFKGNFILSKKFTMYVQLFKSKNFENLHYRESKNKKVKKSGAALLLLLLF